MKTRILTADAAAIEAAAALLAASELVAMPTETVYGLAGNAFDEQAVLKIFAAKERPSFDPLIVHLAPDAGRDLAELARRELIDPAAVALGLRPALDALIAAFWPGPLTLVLPRHPRVPELVTSGLATVALRVPAHPVAQALLARTFPLAAPSANRFGRISPTDAAAVFQELQGRIPLILDGGPCRIGLESTVLGIEADQLCLLRPGQLSAEELAATAGVTIRPQAPHPAEIRAPGMLKSHYAPLSPLDLVQAQAEIPALLQARPGRPGLLLLRPNPELEAIMATRGGRLISLSADAALDEIARGLFAALRQLDGLDFLIAELPPAGSGLAHAIRDRLQKAAAR
ncbi:MAG: L-threonylcarbamoyladenylate synthase [Candidatus Sericytochromatia bacterium]